MLADQTVLLVLTLIIGVDIILFIHKDVFGLEVLVHGTNVSDAALLCRARHTFPKGIELRLQLIHRVVTLAVLCVLVAHNLLQRLRLALLAEDETVLTQQLLLLGQE